MRKSRLNFFLAILIVLFVTLTVLTVFVTEQGPSLPYSAKSAEEDGVRAGYLLLRRFGMDARILDRPISGDIKGILTTVRPAYLKKTDEEWISILNWVYNDGNTLIIFGDYRELAIRLNSLSLPAPVPGMTEWGIWGVFYKGAYGSGEIRYIPENYSYTNGIIDAPRARYFIGCFWDKRDQPIYFDEYNRQSLPVMQSGQDLEEKPAPDPLSLIPVPLQAALVQLILAAFIAMLFYKQRVGRPAIYTEGSLRRDNEDVFALAGLMRRDALREDAVLIYFERFSQAVTGMPDAGIYKVEEYWRLYSYEGLMDLINLLREVDTVRAGRSLSRREAIRIMKEIDRLSQFASKGRFSAISPSSRKRTAV